MKQEYYYGRKVKIKNNCCKLIKENKPLSIGDEGILNPSLIKDPIHPYNYNFNGIEIAFGHYEFSRYLEIVPNTIEELIEEAKRRYPVGSTVKCDFVGNPYQGIIGDDFFGFPFSIWVNLVNNDCKNMCLYSKVSNKWAEIIEKPFVLPEKWCIRNICEETNDYLNKYGKYSTYTIPKFPYIHYGHFPSPDNYCTTYSYIHEGYTEITFEQFKKYVLKENNMENKKVIGYKLSKLEFLKQAVAIEGYHHTGFSNIEGVVFNLKDYADAIDKWKRAEVLDLWFEPVYEQQFKEGDIVVIEDVYISHYKNSGYWNIGNLLKITDVIENHFNCINLSKGNLANGWGFDKLKLRLATKEEIKKLNEIKIAEYPLEILESDNCVKFGCQKIKVEELLAVRTTLELSDRIEEYDLLKGIQAKEITIELINKILNKLIKA